MEIFTGESIAKQFTEFGTPCSFLNITASPQLIKYNFLLENILQLQKVKRLCDNLSALMHTPAKFCDSETGHFAVEIVRPDRQVVKLEQFAQILANSPKYSICLGLSNQQEYKTQTIDQLTHLLVAGTTGSGKSVFLNDIITTLICEHNPQELALILIDTKKVEFNIYADIPHLMFNIVDEVATAKKVLRYLINEMEDRYKTMRHQQIEKWQGQKIIVVIDELADLILQDDEIKPLLIRLLQKARASGIHIICGTQSPRAKILDGVMLANLPSKICLTCANQRESILILGHSGGEKLTGSGDCIFKSPNSINEIRLQTPLISKAEIKQIIQQ